MFDKNIIIQTSTFQLMNVIRVSFDFRIRILMLLKFPSHFKFSAKPSGTFGTCKQYIQLFIVSSKLLFQSFGLFQNKYYLFQNKYYALWKFINLEIISKQIISFILVNKNNSFAAWSVVMCCTQYEFPNGKRIQWNDKKCNNLKKFIISIAFHRKIALFNQ